MPNVVLQIFSRTNAKRAFIEVGQIRVKVAQMGLGLRMAKQGADPVSPTNSPPPIYPAKPVAREVFPKRNRLHVRYVQLVNMPITLTANANPAMWAPFHRNQWTYAPRVQQVPTLHLVKINVMYALQGNISIRNTLLVWIVGHHTTPSALGSRAKNVHMENTRSPRNLPAMSVPQGVE